MDIKIPIKTLLGTLCQLVRSRAFVTACAVMLPYAGVIFGLDIAYHYGKLTGAALPVQFCLSVDRGLGEWYEYALTSAVAIMMLIMALWEGAAAYYATSALFVWLTLDNSIEFHERAGEFLAPYIPNIPGVPVDGAHIGEFLAMSAVAGLWLICLFFSLRASRGKAVVNVLILAGFVAVGAGFGIFDDFINSWLAETGLAEQVSDFVEDGGEHLEIGRAHV